MGALAEFVRKWTHPDYPPVPVTEAGLASVEDHFGIVLPAGYRDSLLAHGAASPTIALLNAIVVLELDEFDLSSLHAPEEIIAATEGWRAADMPDHLVAIASDSGGNQFAFDVRAPGPIWVFDHDFGDVIQIAPDFETWIDRLNRIEPQPDQPF